MIHREILAKDEKRFILVLKDDDECFGITVHACNEEYISHHIDMRDCYAGTYSLFYVTDDMTIVPVQQSIIRRFDTEAADNGFIYGRSALTCNENTVGWVYHTNH